MNMRILLLAFMLAGCGIVGPEPQKIKTDYQITEGVGVTFYAWVSPRDTVWFEMDWWYLGTCYSTGLQVDPDGEAIWALAYVGGEPEELAVLFKAWSTEAGPDSLWYRK